MCRWNAYIGEPLADRRASLRPKHGLIDESLHSRMGAETTNGDGFGLGWYPPGTHGDPARYRSVKPAWNDANLRDLAAHIESPLFMAHIRAAVGSPVQQTNCHPFRHGRWLFVHNGLIDGFAKMRRDLMLAVDPIAVQRRRRLDGLRDVVLPGADPWARGGSDRRDGEGDRNRRAGCGEEGIKDPVQGTIGISDGERLWAIRYSSAHQSRTLFVSEDVDTVRRLHPERPAPSGVVGECPPRCLRAAHRPPGAWHEIPEATALVVDGTSLERRDFAPRV